MLQDLCIEVPGRALLEGASLNLQRGRRYGLIGPNGAGKTTLLQQLAVPGRLVPSNVSSLLVQQDEVGDERTPLETVLSADPHLSSLLSKVSLLKDALSQCTDDAAFKALRTLKVRELRQQASTLAEELASASGDEGKAPPAAVAGSGGRCPRRRSGCDSCSSFTRRSRSRWGA